MSDQPGPRPGMHRNWLSLAGMVLAGSSFFAFLLLMAFDLFSKRGHPYLGLLTYVVSPAFLLLGVVLIALGQWLQRRHERHTHPGAAHMVLTIDLARPRDRKLLAGFVACTVAFLFVTALGSYETYHHTESVQFCGQACHVPMEPQFVTYQHSSHARVACVECHKSNGRLQAIDGVYMPGRGSDHARWLEIGGWLMVGATLLGVSGHGLMRIVSKKRSS